MRSTKIPVPRLKLAFACIGLALLFSSCATLINGPRSTIRLDYGAGTTVLVDGEKLDTNERDVDLRSRKTHTIVMKKDGFKTVTYEIKSRGTATSLLNLPAGWVAAIPFYMNIGDNKDGGQMDRLGLALAATVLNPLIFYTIDWISGSNYKSYPKDVKFVPVKIPPASTTTAQYQIGCTEVNIRMRIGDKIGSLTDIHGKPISDMSWGNTVNVKVDELEVIVNNGLKDLGFNVPKVLGDHGFLLNAEVTGIEINSNVFGANCRLTTKWTLTNVFTNAVVKLATIESFNTVQGRDINTALFSSFENSFLMFLGDHPVVYEVVSRQTPKAEVSNFDEIILPLPKISAKEIISDFLNSVVTIEGEDNGHGSGFLISADGYILTNYHVVKNTKKVNVILHGGLSFIGDVLRSDASHDVALIKLSGNGFPALRMAAGAGEATIGTEVYAIGTPAAKNLEQTVTKGIISGNRLINEVAYLQSDVSVSPGSSGGPLINKSGLVLGIITSKVINRGVEGISFALPAMKAFEILKLRYN